MLLLENSDQIDLNGASLAVQETGSGDPIVLVHGGVSDLRTWSHQYDVLGQRFRTIAYSRRYARPNAAIAENADDPMQLHVDDLAALIVERRAAPVHVIGHSWGGFIALLLAIQKPKLVRSLILIEPPVLTLFVDMPPKPTQLLGLFLRSPRMAFAIMKLGATAMGPAEKAFRRGDDKEAIRAFGRGVLGKDRFESLSTERYDQVWQNRGPVRAQLLGSGFPPLAARDVARVRMPVLLVCGNQSPAAFRFLSQHLAALLPNGRRTIIPGASHIVHEDAPDLFNSEVTNFLSSL